MHLRLAKEHQQALLDKFAQEQKAFSSKTAAEEPSTKAASVEEKREAQVTETFECAICFQVSTSLLLSHRCCSCSCSSGPSLFGPLFLSGVFYS